jgi:uracil-DNA glycosylase
MHVAAPPFEHTSGPQTAKVVFVGEAWGKSEDLLKKPLVGGTGREFLQMLRDVEWPGLTEPRYHNTSLMSELDMMHYWSAQNFLITNTFAFRPENNKIITLCGSKKDVGGKSYTHSPIQFGKYLRPEYFSELQRLKFELESIKPNLIIALGAVASWALLGINTISTIRGTLFESTLVPGLKVIPTFHPANIFRQWANRPILLADLIKAKGEIGFPEVRRPERQILVNPTLQDLHDYYAYVSQNPAAIMALDIETSCKTITCISFSISPDYALVIPFHEPLKPSGNYWDTKEEEIEAWKVVRDLLLSPNPKLFQNGLYDLQYLARMGFKIVNVFHDTMLLHHALYPEMDKGLGFLGSIYTGEPAWKLMRKRRGQDVVKAEE